MSRIKDLVYNLVDEALRADSSKSNEIAFVLYLRSIATITDALIKDADENQVYPNRKNIHLKNFLKIAKQCLERVEEISETLGNENNSSYIHQSTETSVNDVNPENFSFLTVHADMPSLNDFNQPSSANKENSSLIDLSFLSFEAGATTVPFVTRSQPVPLTPLERVDRENQKLKTAYTARLARTQNIGARIDLHLALQRRLAENITLARAKEVVLNHRKHETQRRLLEQASRIIGSSHSISSKETENRKQIYAKILNFEQQVTWPQVLRDKLKTNPRDFVHIDVTIKKTLSTPDHPLCQLMRTLHYTIYDKVIHLISRCTYRVNEFASHDCNVNENENCHDWMSNQSEIESHMQSLDLEHSELGDEEELQTQMLEAFDLQRDVSRSDGEKTYDRRKKHYDKSQNLKEMEEEALQRHMHYIVVDVRYSLDKLLNMMVLTYELLNSPEAFDQCYASMEEMFFKPLWPYLMQLFRLAFKSEELVIGKLMEQLPGKNLSDLCGLNILDNCHTETPYINAIKEMGNVVNLRCPLKKLDTLVRVAHLICEDEYNTAHSKAIGADDLIPILCYVVLKTGSPQIMTECYAMAEFIHEGYLMGEEGYCLTSLQTVFQYLKSQTV